MWGSSQWKSNVTVSEGHLLPELRDNWREMIFQNVAINRFTGGAAEKKLFNALAITRATFEGSITVFGDQLWMLGLIALFLKDMQDGFVRIGSGKTRGRGKMVGWLTKMEVKAISESDVASNVFQNQQIHDGRLWKSGIWSTIDPDKPTSFLDILDGWAPGLLEKGVQELQDVVRDYVRMECRNPANATQTEEG